MGGGPKYETLSELLGNTLSSSGPSSGTDRETLDVPTPSPLNPKPWAQEATSHRCVFQGAILEWDSHKSPW